MSSIVLHRTGGPVVHEKRMKKALNTQKIGIFELSRDRHPKESKKMSKNSSSSSYLHKKYSFLKMPKHHKFRNTVPFSPPSNAKKISKLMGHKIAELTKINLQLKNGPLTILKL